LVEFDFDARNDENDYDDKDEDDEKEETIEHLVSLEIQQFDSEIRKNKNTRHIALDDESEYGLDFNGNLHHELIKDLNLIVGLNKIARYNCCLHKANGPAKITIKEKDSYNRFTT